MNEIISSKLIYGVSTKSDEAHSSDFIKLFDTGGLMGGKSDYSPITAIECYHHDPAGKLFGDEVEPIYVAGVTLGISITDICCIDPEIITTAQEIFEDAVQEFNDYMNKLGSDYKIALTPTLLLFGEGLIKDE